MALSRVSIDHLLGVFPLFVHCLAGLLGLGLPAGMSGDAEHAMCAWE